MTVGSVRRIKAAWALGKIRAIEYDAADDQKGYRHDFGVKSRPALAASSDGKQLVIVGGRYRVTKRGIEDGQSVDG